MSSSNETRPTSDAQDFSKPAVLNADGCCVECGRDHDGAIDQPCDEECPMYWEAIGVPHPAPAPGFVQFLYWDRPSNPSWNIYFSRPWSSPLDERLSRRVGNEEALWFFCRQFAFRDETGRVYGPFRPVDALGNPAPDSWFEERK